MPSCSRWRPTASWRSWPPPSQPVQPSHSTLADETRVAAPCLRYMPMLILGRASSAACRQHKLRHALQRLVSGDDRMQSSLRFKLKMLCADVCWTTPVDAVDVQMHQITRCQSLDRVCTVPPKQTKLIKRSVAAITQNVHGWCLKMRLHAWQTKTPPCSQFWDREIIAGACAVAISVCKVPLQAVEHSQAFQTCAEDDSTCDVEGICLINVPDLQFWCKSATCST